MKMHRWEKHCGIDRIWQRNKGINNCKGFGDSGFAE